MDAAAQEQLRRAIEVVTAWNEGVDLHNGIILETAKEGDRALADLTVGLAQLAGVLLIELEKVRSESANELLQQLAIFYTEPGNPR